CAGANSRTHRWTTMGRLKLYSILTCLLASWLAVAQRSALAQSRANAEHWAGTWATAPVARAVADGRGQQGEQGSGGGQSQQTGRGAAASVNFNDQTLRQIVHTSIGGRRVRVIFSNVYGTSPLAIGGARVALGDKAAAIVANSGRELTF